MKGRNKVRLVILVGVVGAMALEGTGAAMADGVFAKKSALTQRDIVEPEQKAVIVYTGGNPRGQVPGKETLILSVKYEGAAGDFAWVVPVPSRPEVEKGEAKIFEELAVLTPAVQQEGAGGMMGFRATGPSAKGVEVLERRVVGVYDVAVLAATDETALASWLKDNGYALPGDPEPVLRHYVEKGWYYVAMRIDATRPAAGLVETLRTVDPGMDSVEKAKEIAVREAEEGILAHSDYRMSRLARIVEAVAQAEPSARMGDIYSQYEADVKDYARWGTEDGKPSPHWAAIGILGARLRSSIGRMVSESHLDVETLAMGEPRPDETMSAEEFLDELVAGDIRGGRAYETSHLVHAQAMAATGRADPFLPAEYQESLEAYWEERNVGADSDVPKGEIAGWRLRKEIGDMFGGGRAQLERRLKQGTLEPISLSFACDGPIYPLRMTSLNSGKTDILLYVLAERRAKVEGFRVRYAAEMGLGRQNRPQTQYVMVDQDWAFAKLLTTGWYGEGEKRKPFLTKLQADLQPAQMGDDLRIEFERRNKPYIETISAPLSPAPMVRPRPLPLPRAIRQRLVRDVAAGSGAAFVVGVILTLVVMKRGRGKGAA
jgi:hypothetical protein